MPDITNIAMFDHKEIDLDILKQRAYNLRWATVPSGVIPLTAADPDFPCAPQISEAIERFVKDRYLSYGPPEGMSEFKEMMASYFQLKRNIKAEPKFCLPVDSAAFGIYVICKAILKTGDEAIIFDPVDFLFRYSIENVNATAIPFKIPPGDHPIDFDQLDSLISDKTKMLCLCNPLNPTGKVFTRSELIRFGELARKHDLIILSDEIWSDITYNPYSFTSMASLSELIFERTITVTGFSKSYGLAGLRIGAILSPNETLYKKIFNASLHLSTIHGANIIGQVAATTALRECGDWLDKFIDHLQSMRDICVTRINALPNLNVISPQGTYVAFINIMKTGKSSSEISNLLFEEAKVLVVPGGKQWFGDGAERYIRISFATSDIVLHEAFDRIERIILNERLT
ncbi:MAG: pyridoxal phosphate-dependent aminotransferase [Ginsengibacter sp.]